MVRDKVASGISPKEDLVSDFTVTWSVDIFDAESPQDAAEQALEYIRDNGDQCFLVVDADRNTTTVNVR